MDQKWRFIKDRSRYQKYFRLELLFRKIEYTNTKNGLYSRSFTKLIKSNLRNLTSWMVTKENLRYQTSSTRTYFIIWFYSKCSDWLKSRRIKICWKDIKKTLRHGDLKQIRTKNYQANSTDKKSIFNDKKLFIMA